MQQLMRFKYWLYILVGLGVSIGAAAQSTTVSGTVTDQGGQVWANGTISYVFQNNGSFSGPYQWNGGNLPNQYLTPQIVTLSGSGTFSFSIPTSTAIAPALSTWKYVVCPNASFQCAILTVPSAGSTQNISSQITAAAATLVNTIQAGPMPLAYTDAEIITAPNQGGIYFNVISFLPKYFDGSSWHFYGSGGGGSPGGAGFSVQYNNGGAFGGASFNGIGFFSTSAVPVAATFSNIVALWAGGSCTSGFLAFNGTCSTPTGGTPASPQFSMQFNAGGGNFGASPESVDSTGTTLIATFGSAVTNGSNQWFSRTDKCSPTSLPGLTPGSPLIEAGCEYVIELPTMGGWNLGNAPVGGTGWLTFVTRENTSRLAEAGIKSFDDISGQCNGIGDCDVRDDNITARGSGMDYSGEGVSYQKKMLEGAEQTGTITSGSVGANTIGVAKTGNSDGIGLPIIDLTYDLITTNITDGGHTTTYNIVNSSTTLPVSVQCSTVATAGIVATQQEGIFTATTFTVNTSVDLTSSVGLLVTTVSPFPQTAKLVSTGSAPSGGVQTITLNLNKSVAAGSAYCVGGLAGRGLEQTLYTVSGRIYLFTVVGSPTASTMWLTVMTSQGPSHMAVSSPLNQVTTFAANIYHMATIVGFPTTTSYALSDNDARWSSTGGINTWLSTNSVQQTWLQGNDTVQFFSPYAISEGEVWDRVNSLSLTGDRYHTFKNENNPNSYYTHCPGGVCGLYGAPLGQVFQGVIGAGQYWFTSPEGCYFSGNQCFSAAIAMGSIASGSTMTTWPVAAFQANDDEFGYIPSSRIWYFTTNNVGFLKVDGSKVCTVANGACSSGSGTVTSVSSGNLSPLFTVSIATATTTPAITFTATAQAANTVYGNFTGSSAAATFSASPVFSAANLTSFPTFNQNTTGQSGTVNTIAGNLSFTNFTTTGVGTLASPFSVTGIALAGLPSLSANTVLGALTATTPSGLAMPSCSGASNALTWTSGTGFGCNTITGSGGITFPQTVAGTVNSGGIIFASSTTQISVSATNTAGQAVLWGGAGTAPGAISLTSGGTATVLVRGVTTSGNNDLIAFNGTGGDSKDSGVASTNLMLLSGAQTATGAKTFSAGLITTTFGTSTNCSQAVNPAVCGSAASGNAVVAAAGTTVVVNTTAVTTSSQIQLTFDSSLGTKLGVTCNTTPSVLAVSARSGGVSFTVTTATPAVNPACFSYTIIN